MNGVSEILQVTEIQPASVGLEEREKSLAAPQGSWTPGRASRIAWLERYENPVPFVEKRKVIAVGDSRWLSTRGRTYRRGAGGPPEEGPRTAMGSDGPKGITTRKPSDRSPRAVEPPDGSAS